MSVPQPAVIVFQPPDELLFALFGILLLPPFVDDLVCLGVVKATVRASVERGEKKCSGLLRLDEGQHRSESSDQFFGFLPVPRYRVGRQQHCVEFAAHDVGIHAQAAVLLHCFGGQLAVGFGYSVSRAMETP